MQTLAKALIITALLITSACSTNHESQVEQNVFSCEQFFYKRGIMPRPGKVLQSNDVGCNHKFYNKEPDIIIPKNSFKYLFFFTPLFGMLAQDSFVKSKIVKVCNQKGFATFRMVAHTDEYYGWCVGEKLVEVQP